MLVFVVRHGESETNEKSLWTGWLDVNLTDKGKEDARKAGEFLKNFHFDYIYTSDLKRARDTAKTALTGCNPEETELLREVNVGKISGKPISVLTDEEKEYCSINGFGKFEGETKLQFKNRVSQFMEKLEGLDCENVAVFSHGGWLTEMLNTVVGQRIPRPTICCNNCTIGIFEYREKRWRLHSWINPMNA